MIIGSSDNGNKIFNLLIALSLPTFQLPVIAAAYTTKKKKKIIFFLYLIDLQ